MRGREQMEAYPSFYYCGRNKTQILAKYQMLLFPSVYLAIKTYPTTIQSNIELQLLNTISYMFAMKSS